MTLKLAPDLVLPDTFATEGVVAVGMRGSGKSNTLVRWAEVLYAARIPFVAVDPKGDWYGVKSSADGKSAGLSVPVFGGHHGDGPLDEHMGAALADLLVDNNMSAVLDVSRLSKAKRATFLTAFCIRLMERHQAEPHVRCVIFEEAHKYIPQQIVGGGPAVALKEAAAAILLEGRAFGLGCWAATQRPARLHKDVLEEVGTVVLHRIGAAATNDLRTITGWVKHEELAPEISASLTKLRPGEAWVLSPVEFDIVKRVLVDRRHTFDSASTPTAGAGRRPSLTMADVDMAAITAALAASIEKAKESDPAELRKRLKAMEREMAALERRLAEHVPERVEVQVEVPVEVVPPSVVEAMRVLRRVLEAQGERITEALDKATAAVEAVPDRPSRSTPGDPPPRGKRAAAPATHTRPPRPAAPARTLPADHAAVNGPRQKILNAIAWYVSVGVTPASRSHVALVAGTSPNSSGYEKNLGALRTAGLIEYPKGGYLALTAEGEQIATVEVEVSTVEELIPVLTDKLGRPKGRILELVAKHYPDPISREDLAAEIPVSAVSSGFEKNLGGLRSLGFIEYPERGYVVATEALMIDR